MIEKMEAEGAKTLGGEDAFRLYDTYGFPLDLSKEILEEKGMDADEEGFRECMEVQRKKARDAREVTNYMGCLLYTSGGEGDAGDAPQASGRGGSVHSPRRVEHLLRTAQPSYRKRCILHYGDDERLERRDHQPGV